MSPARELRGDGSGRVPGWWWTWILVAIGSSSLPGGAWSQPLPRWKVDHLQIAIQILPQDRIRVEEQIALDLGFERHRQLERRIRLAPLTGDGRRLDVRLIAVTDAQGAAWPIRTWQWGDNLEIRIGNGESFLTGRQSVHLVYEVDGAVQPGRQRDALVWDVAGGPWEVPIIDTRITVTLPPGAEPEMIDAGSEVGRPGELVRRADFKTVDPAQVRFSLMTGLAPRETCRIFVSWPTQLTPPQHLPQRWWRALALRPWWGATAAALALTALAALARSRARARARAVNAPRPGLAPAELAWLVRSACDGESLLATTLELARRGELTLLPAAADGFRVRRSGAESEGPERTPIEQERPFEGAWRARIFGASSQATPADGECTAAELAWRARLAAPAVASALASGLVASGYLHDRRRSRLLGRIAWRLVIAIALGAFLAILVGARFPAAWPGIGLAALGAALLPVAIEGRRRTTRGEAAAAWARAFAARMRRYLDQPGTAPLDAAWLPFAAALGVGPEVLLARAERPSYWPPLVAGAPPTRANLLREWEVLARPFRSAPMASEPA